MAVEGARLLDKTLSYVDIALGSPEAFPADVTGDNWKPLENLLTPTFVNRAYYDLSGYTQHSLTTFFQAVDVQEAFAPFGSAACRVVDLVTTEFISDSELVAAYQYTTGDGDLPGFPLSTFNMEQVVYGRTRTFTSNSAFGDITLQGSSMWGTCSAATADKLHITRLVMVLNTADPSQTVHIPPCNYVTAVIVSEENDLSFIMRQKRSYELANQG